MAFGGLGIYCLDLDGKLLWDQPLEPYKTRYGWGSAASPVLHQDRVYYLNDNDEKSYLAAYDAASGKEIWKTERDEKSNWSTPFLWKNSQRSEIVTAGTGQVRSYDLDGNLLWWLEGMSSITIATPYADDDLLYISSGYVADRSRPVYAIRPGGKGDITLDANQSSNDSIAWFRPTAAPYNPSTLVYQDVCYVLHDRGFFAAYNASDGEEIYRKQRIRRAGGFTSSPWAYDDKVFCLDENGVTHVIQAGDEYKLLHTNKLADDDMGMATPAMVGDRLLLRTNRRIYCIKQLQ